MCLLLGIMVRVMPVICAWAISGWLLDHSVWLLHFKSYEDSFSSLRYQTSYNLLSNILCWVVQQFFKLETWKLLNYFILSPDHNGILGLKLIIFVFFLEHIFDESSASISHFTQSIVQSFPHLIWLTSMLATFFLYIWHVPNIMADEFLHTLRLVTLYLVFLELLQVPHQSWDVLDQDIISSYHDFRWLFLIGCLLVLLIILAIWILILLSFLST